MTRDWYDPWQSFPYAGDKDTAREFLDKGIQYNGVSTEFVVKSLYSGDVVEVEVYKKNNSKWLLEVEEFKLEFCITKTETGKEIDLWARTEYMGKDMETMLRGKNGTSYGVVRGIKVVELAETS